VNAPGARNEEVMSNRYQKINKNSDGYKKGYRYIDYGKNITSKIRFLKKKPAGMK